MNTPLFGVGDPGVEVVERTGCDADDFVPRHRKTLSAVDSTRLSKMCQSIPGVGDRTTMVYRRTACCRTGSRSLA